MKTLNIALAALATAGFAGEASAHGERMHRERHCGACVKLFETTRWEKKEVRRCENVLVGYRDEIVGYRDEVVGYRDEIVGYEDVWVERPVTVYETRTVYRNVFAGYDRCGRPIYRSQPVCERVPVCRTQRVCEKRPIYQKRPVCEKRPICEKRPVYEKREVVTCEWVQVPHAMYVCVK